MSDLRKIVDARNAKLKAKNKPKTRVSNAQLAKALGPASQDLIDIVKKVRLSTVRTGSFN